jgi:hypothetical protein
MGSALELGLSRLPLVINLSVVLLQYPTCTESYVGRVIINETVHELDTVGLIFTRIIRNKGFGNGKKKLTFLLAFFLSNKKLLAVVL